MRLKLLFLVSILVVGNFVWAPGAVQAGTIVVNTTADELNNNGSCSIKRPPPEP